MKSELEKLRRRETLFEATRQIGNFGYCEWDYDKGRIKSCSPEYARIFGMSIEETIASQSCWEKVLLQILPEDREYYADSYHNDLGKGAHDIEYRILREDGEIRYIREMGVVFFDDDGAEIDSMGLLQDITERKLRELELETGHALVRQFELIPDIGHYLWDLEAETYIYTSPGYARIFGISPGDFTQRVNSLDKDMALVHEDDREEMSRVFRERKNGKSDIDEEYRILRPDGEIRWVHERSITVRDASGKVNQSIGVLQDITAQKAAEQSLLQSRDLLESEVAERTRQLAASIEQLEAEMSERNKISSALESQNAELERFAYTVSHDLKSPLVTINGFLGMLTRDLAANKADRVANDIAKISSAVNTMGRLLDDLLEHSRVGRVMGEPRPCDLSTIVGQALEQLAAQIERQPLQLHVDEMPAVMGDEIRLVEVFVNLIENAIKFMGDQASPSIHVGARKTGGMVKCRVLDNGIGIDARFHERVFDLFERLDSGPGGTGVGLALVKRIVETHGGEIHVESDGPGRGSCMIFTLPAA